MVLHLYKIKFWYVCLFPIIYINAVWFQFLYRINAAFCISPKFVPYKPETVKGWTKLKEQTANSDTFTLDLANMNEVMVMLVYTSGSRVYSNTFPQYILEAGYKAVVSMVDSNNPTNDVCTLQKSGSTYSGTIPSNSFKMIVYAR